MALCFFGRAGSSQDSAGTNQPQAVAKSSVKSGTKGFTGLEGIKLTRLNPGGVRTRVCVCVAQLRILYKSFLKALSSLLLRDYRSMFEVE